MSKYVIDTGYLRYPNGDVELCWVLPRLRDDADCRCSIRSTSHNRRLYRSIIKNSIESHIVITSDHTVIFYRGRLNKVRLIDCREYSPEDKYVYCHIDHNGVLISSTNEREFFGRISRIIPLGERVTAYKYPLNSLYFEHCPWDADHSWKDNTIENLSRCNGPVEFYDMMMRLMHVEEYQIDAAGNRYNAVGVSDDDNCLRSLYEIRENWHEVASHPYPYLWRAMLPSEMTDDRYCGNILEDSDARI